MGVPQSKKFYVQKHSKAESMEVIPLLILGYWERIPKIRKLGVEKSNFSKISAHVLRKHTTHFCLAVFISGTRVL